MAYFYGVVVGQAKTQASRRSNRTRGLQTVAASWNGCIRVSLWHDPATGTDRFSIRAEPWHGSGHPRTPVDIEGVF